MENETLEQHEDHEEHVIILVRDLNLPDYVKHENKEMFYCPVCKNSLVYLSDEYAKNNMVNAIEKSVDEDVINKWDRIILKCSSCKYIDLISKFLNKKERRDYSTLMYDEASVFKPIYKPYGRPFKRNIATITKSNLTSQQ